MTQSSTPECFDLFVNFRASGMLCQAVTAAEVFLSKRETESLLAARLLLCAMRADSKSPSGFRWS